MKKQIVIYSFNVILRKNKLNILKDMHVSHRPYTAKKNLPKNRKTHKRELCLRKVLKLAKLIYE